MKIDKKMKSCFTQHTIMHSLIGFGLGIFLSALFGIANIWLGLLIMIVAIVWDTMRKK